MANLIYNSFKEYMGDNTIDMDGDTFKIALLTSSHTPDATDSTYADVSGDEVSGTGYTAGGATLTATWTRSGGTTTFDADNVTWSSSTITAQYAVIYSDTPTSPADPLVCLLDFSEDKSSSNGDFTVNFNASGIISLS